MLLLVAVTRGAGLFTKNIADRYSERTSTVRDACPARVPEARVQPGQGPVSGGGNPHSPIKNPGKFHSFIWICIYPNEGVRNAELLKDLDGKVSADPIL